MKSDLFTKLYIIRLLSVRELVVLSLMLDNPDPQHFQRVAGGLVVKNTDL